MTRILVVDDSEVDRRLVGGLLEDDGEYEVDFASDGNAALEAMDAAMPDIILTDLVMPGMDGLELVAVVQEKHPFVPVILVTSRGSEEIAVRALQAGASNYVPKRTLAEDLLDTVETAVSNAAQRRGRTELMKSMNHWEAAFTLGNDRRSFPALISFLQEAISNLGTFEEGDRTRIGVALEESLVNAAEHGNLELDSSLRQDDRIGYLNLLQERLVAAPFQERQIEVEARITGEEARFMITDEGSGFDWSDLPDPTDPQNLLKVSGRGVMLMRTFMDDVSYNESGNQVKMIKRCAAADAAASE